MIIRNRRRDAQHSQCNFRKGILVSTMNALVWLLPAFGLHFAAHPSFGQHEGDLIIGRSSAGQLKATGFDTTDFVVLPAVSGLLNGWSDNDPGFDYLTAPNVPNDILPLQAGAMIHLEIISLSPAIRALGPGLSPILDDPGDQVLLGDSQLHEHLTWHINSQSPLFDIADCVWSITFKLTDSGVTNYTDSDAIVLKFVAVANLGQDCNGNGIRDTCDLSLPLSIDCNGNNVPDECDTVAPCGDFDTCTCDVCVEGDCTHIESSYGDVNCSGGAANLDDILCVLAGFGMFGRCPNGDIAPQGNGNGAINLDDILAELAAFSGNNPCG